MNVQKMSIACDFTAPTFERAVGMCRVMPNEVTIFCAPGCAVTAWELVEKYGCKAVLVPPELLAGEYHWAVVGGSDMVWSSGA